MDVSLNTLAAMDLPPRFMHCISLCFPTELFSVQVNGDLSGFSKAQGVFVRGFALLPYMFVITMNILSKLLDKSAS